MMSGWDDVAGSDGEEREKGKSEWGRFGAFLIHFSIPAFPLQLALQFPSTLLRFFISLSTVPPDSR
jgi:hypothetical protein